MAVLVVIFVGISCINCTQLDCPYTMCISPLMDGWTTPAGSSKKGDGIKRVRGGRKRKEKVHADVSFFVNKLISFPATGTFVIVHCYI